MSKREKGELHAMLFGYPVLRREDDKPQTWSPSAELDGVILATLESLQREYTDVDDSLSQAVLEWSRLIKLDKLSYEGIACRRAAVLFAMGRHPPVAEHFMETDPELVDDLVHRILPLVMPGMIRTMGQQPDAFVLSCCVLHTLWKDVPIGSTIVRSGCNVTLDDLEEPNGLPSAAFAVGEGSDRGSDDEWNMG